MMHDLPPFGNPVPITGTVQPAEVYAAFDWTPVLGTCTNNQPACPFCKVRGACVGREKR